MLSLRDEWSYFSAPGFWDTEEDHLEACEKKAGCLENEGRARTKRAPYSWALIFGFLEVCDILNAWTTF